MRAPSRFPFTPYPSPLTRSYFCAMSKTISLDTDAKKLGITKGQVYALDLFHAERHSNESNFNIIANLHFVDCGVIVPSGPVK